MFIIEYLNSNKMFIRNENYLRRIETFRQLKKNRIKLTN